MPGIKRLRGRIGEELLSTRREVFGDRHPETLVAMNNLAYSLWGLQELDAAHVLAEQALEGEKELSATSTFRPSARWTRSPAYFATRGSLDSARGSWARRPLLPRAGCSGARNYDTLVLMTNLVDTLRVCGDLNAAVDLAEQVVSLSARRSGRITR